MNKRLLFSWAALALCSLPIVAAHGAAPTREIDTRVLQDDDGTAGYTPDTCAPVPGCPFASGAPDLLALDLREASTADGQPVLWFRAAYQTEVPAGPKAIHITLTAAGKAHELDFTSADGVAFTSGTFAKVVGPTPIGDGHPKALDGMLFPSALGLGPGDTLTGISVESHGAGNAGDLMPGGWSPSEGVEVAPIPNPAESERSFPGAYTLSGPAPLLRMMAMGALDLTAAKGLVMVHVENALSATQQFANLSVTAPAGVVATFDPASVALDGGAAKMATLRLVKATGDGVLNVTVRSDLGAYAVLSIPYQGAPAHHDSNTTALPGSGTGDATSRLPGPSSSHATPLPLPFLAMAVSLLVARRRR